MMKRAFFLGTLLIMLMPMQALCCSGTASGTCSGDCEPPAESSKASISTSTLSSLVKAKTPLVLIDCRDAKEDDGRRLPGAKVLTASATPEQLALLIPKKETLIVTYDNQKEETDRAVIIKTLNDNGYLNVIDYSNGLTEWVNAGNSVETDSTVKPVGENAGEKK